MEANGFVFSWCRQTDWARNRAVVFLDPYGMQVEWTTIKAIADTRAIDLWWLVPVGIGLNRLLTRGGLPSAGWADALTRSLGTDEWKSVFYARDAQTMLFDNEPREHKVAGIDRLGRFVLHRLKSVFAKVATNPLTLRNSKNTPIYLLCFAAGNPRVATTAVKIAEDILKL
jgi:three-Cys-motif partner protein